MRRLYFGLAVLSIMGSCAAPPVPNTSPAAISTIVAATFRAASSATSPAASAGSATAIKALDASQTAANPAPALVAASATLPPPLPTNAQLPIGATLPAAGRLGIRGGFGSITVSGKAEPGRVPWYVVQGTQAQPMIVRLESPSQGAVLSIRTQGGTSFASPAASQVSWRGSLPRTEDYYVGVYAASSAVDFVLTVSLAARIKFKEGAAAASVGGKTYAGSSAVFTVLGIKGQTMIVSLSGAGRDAALSIYGYVTGERYLQPNAGKTSFKLKIPSTQDYVIEVVPKGGKTVPFVLDVQFP